MPPFRDALARRVNERETGASLGLETGAVAAGIVAAGAEVTGAACVAETSGVEETGTFGVVEISGVMVAGGAGVSDGIRVGSVVAVASGSGDAGMWVSRGNSDILEFKEGAFVSSEVQPQKSAVMML